MTGTIEAPTLNTGLLAELVRWAGQDVADLAEEFEAKGWPKWDQAMWAKQVINGSCETFCCIAGNAIMQTEGWGLVYNRETLDGITGRTVREVTSTVQQTITMTGKDGRPVEVINPGGDEESITKVAGEILGLTRDEANVLFNENNTLADIVYLALMIAEQRGTYLDLPYDLSNLQWETSYMWVDPTPTGRFVKR